MFVNPLQVAVRVRGSRIVDTSPSNTADNVVNAGIDGADVVETNDNEPDDTATRIATAAANLMARLRGSADSVGQPQLQAALEASLPRSSALPPSLLSRLAHKLLELADVDGDGTVSLAELQQLMQRYPKLLALLLSDDEPKLSLPSRSLSISSSSLRNPSAGSSPRATVTATTTRPFCRCCLHSRKAVFYGVVLFLACVAAVGGAIYRYSAAGASTSGIIAHCGGALLYVGVALLCVSMLRRTVAALSHFPAFARSLPSGSLTTLHIAGAVSMLVSLPIHVGGHIGDWTSRGLTVDYIFSSANPEGLKGVYNAGITGILLTIAIGTMAFGYIIRTQCGKYPVFYWTHVLLIPTVWILFIIHAPFGWYILTLPVLLFFMELYSRSMSVYTSPCSVLSYALLAGDAVELRITRPPGFSFIAGQYVWISIPALHMEWTGNPLSRTTTIPIRSSPPISSPSQNSSFLHDFHPFCVSSPPEASEVLTFHIRATANKHGWTRRLREYLEWRASIESNERVNPVSLPQSVPPVVQPLKRENNFVIDRDQREMRRETAILSRDSTSGENMDDIALPNPNGDASSVTRTNTHRQSFRQSHRPSSRRLVVLPQQNMSVSASRLASANWATLADELQDRPNTSTGGKSNFVDELAVEDAILIGLNGGTKPTEWKHEDMEFQLHPSSNRQLRSLRNTISTTSARVAFSPSVTSQPSASTSSAVLASSKGTETIARKSMRGVVPENIPVTHAETSELSATVSTVKQNTNEVLTNTTDLPPIQSSSVGTEASVPPVAASVATANPISTTNGRTTQRSSTTVPQHTSTSFTPSISTVSRRDSSLADKLLPPLLVHIEGPYPAPCQAVLTSARHAILIAAGMGITPASSILASVLARVRAAEAAADVLGEVHTPASTAAALWPCERLDLVWLNAEGSHFAWVLPLLQKFEVEAQRDPSLLAFLRVTVYLTSLPADVQDARTAMLHLALDALCDEEGVDVVVGLKGTRTIAGRPHWPSLFTRLIAAGPAANVATAENGGVPSWFSFLPCIASPDAAHVFFCGPPRMAGDVKAAAWNLGLPFHGEAY